MSKYKLKENVTCKNAVVHCPEEWMWDAVTEALGCVWGNGCKWINARENSCILLNATYYDCVAFYREGGYTIHNFHDIFEPIEETEMKTEELYDLTKIGRVPEGVMVEVSNVGGWGWGSCKLLELVFIGKACTDVVRPYVCIGVDGQLVHFVLARHPQPKQKTRPMNFEEVCEKRDAGALFYHKSGYSVYKAQICPPYSKSKKILIGNDYADEFTHYTLPEDNHKTEHKLEAIDE